MLHVSRVDTFALQTVNHYNHEDFVSRMAYSHDYLVAFVRHNRFACNSNLCCYSFDFDYRKCYLDVFDRWVDDGTANFWHPGLKEVYCNLNGSYFLDNYSKKDRFFPSFDKYFMLHY